MKDNKRFSIIDRYKSFNYAFNGLRLFIAREHNGRIHLCAAILAILLSWYLHLSAIEWVAILGVITMVLVTEILNSAIEKLADVISPGYDPKIKMVKDLAAAAVLVTAFFALAVGGIVFIPKLFL